MIAAGEFVEWAHVHGKRYGTSRGAIAHSRASGNDVMLEIDYQGAAQIRRLFPDACIIFILPPSWETLKARLERRGEDSPDVIAMRLTNAAAEMSHAASFDFVIINEVFERALFDLKAIVHAQRLRYAAQRNARAAIFQSLGIA